MHNHTRRRLTSSANVAQHKELEDQRSLTDRADNALYAAKKAGKNRVIAAN